MLFAANLVNLKVTLAHTEANGYTDEYLSSRGSIGVGMAVVNFDTKIKLIDKTSGISLFLDPEGILDLPETARVSFW